ncbi:MAG: glycosyltransferase family 2 protein [Candidatus Micrarchaeota archaeon]
MANKCKVIVVMPAFNQAKTLPSLLQKFFQLKLTNAAISKIVIVDDASTDNTRQIIAKMKSAKIKYVREQTNVGPSQAILDGFRTAYKLVGASKNCIVVRMDSDGDHNPFDIAKLVAPIVNKRADAAVIDADFGLSNGLIDLVYNRIFGVLQGKTLLLPAFRQTSPGFYAFKADTLKSLIRFREHYVKVYAKKYGKVDLYGIDLSVFAFFYSSIKIIKIKAHVLEKGRRSLGKIYGQGKEILRHFRVIKELSRLN